MPCGPSAVFLGFLGSGLPLRERAFLGWFGVRGIGSLYYVAVALVAGSLALDDAQTIFWAVAACVVTSIIVHGVTGTPAVRQLARRACRAYAQPSSAIRSSSIPKWCAISWTTVMRISSSSSSGSSPNSSSSGIR